MDRTYIFFVLTLLAIQPGCYNCLTWPSGPEADAVVYACARSTLSLPWMFREENGDSVVNIEWLYAGRSDEVIATFIHGIYLPSPAFSGRVSKTTNGGIEIDHVTVAEAGNYSVDVLVRQSNGNVVTFRRTAIVVVNDGLQTTDSQLHVAMDPVAEYDSTTDQFHVVLRCGIFTYVTRPPFEATWETPAAHAVSSSSYHNGSFHLRLPNPVQGGSYTCRVPAASACLHGNGLGEVTLTVDGMEARMMVLETRQEQLASQKDQLERQLAAWQSWKTIIDDILSMKVSFHAKHLDDIIAHDEIIAPQYVITNEGNGYNATSGRFTAPYNGVYAFIFSSETSDAGKYLRIRLKMGNIELDASSAKAPDTESINYAIVTVNAAVRMTRGQQVWIHCSSDCYCWGRATTFSGFLVSADP